MRRPPSVSQPWIVQSRPCHYSPSTNPKILGPQRGGTRGINVIAGSNREADLGFLFVCESVCKREKGRVNGVSV